MKIQQVDDRFATSRQFQPQDVPELAAAGHRGIVCGRRDGEDARQPQFAAIAAAAAAGLQAFHIPVSGQLTEGNLIRFEQALARINGPILDYCRSGGRASSLYQATR